MTTASGRGISAPSFSSRKDAILGIKKLMQSSLKKL